MQFARAVGAELDGLFHVGGAGGAGNQVDDPRREAVLGGEPGPELFVVVEQILGVQKHDAVFGQEIEQRGGGTGTSITLVVPKQSLRHDRCGRP